MADEPIQNLYGFLQSLCRQELDFLANPEIEKKMACSLDCCVGNSMPKYFDEILADKDKNKHRYEEIIGIDGLELLRKFEKIESLAIYYDGPPGSGFSSRGKWKEFAFLAKRLSKHIRKAVRDHKKHGKLQIDRYAKNHTKELVDKFVKPLAVKEKPYGYDLVEYIARSQFVLDYPDKYAGLKDDLFRQIKRLYFLSSLLLEDYKDGDLFGKVNTFNKKEPDSQRIKELQSCAQTIIDMYDTKQNKI